MTDRDQAITDQRRRVSLVERSPRLLAPSAQGCTELRCVGVLMHLHWRR